MSGNGGILLPIIEDVVSIAGQVSLDVMVDLFAVKAELYQPNNNPDMVYRDIYQNYEGDNTELVSSTNIDLLLSGPVYAFFTRSDIDFALPVESLAYIREADESIDIKPGAKVKIVKLDNGSEYWFRLENVNTIGLTKEIIKQYRLIYLEN